MTSYWLVFLTSYFMYACNGFPCHKRNNNVNNGTYVDCSGINLTEIPPDLPNDTSILDFSFNNITILRNYSFVRLDVLEILDLSYNHIFKIESDAFYRLTSLKKLELSGHYLDFNNNASLPVIVFEPLQSLEYLSLGSNEKFHAELPLVLPDQALSQIKHLTTLYIITSRITIFGNGFSILRNLHTLVVGEYNLHGIKNICGMKYISKNTFEVFGDVPLRSLNLNGCCLEYFEDSFLQHFPVLDSLFMHSVWLYNNTLNDLIGSLVVYHNHTLTCVDMSDFTSKVSAVTQNSYISMDGLSKICISHLDLSNSHIATLNLDPLFTFPLPLMTKCLKHLFLSRNRLTGHLSPIYFFMFYLFDKLETIDLSLQRTFMVNPTRHDWISHKKNRSVELTYLFPPTLTSINIAGVAHSVGKMPGLHVLKGDMMTYLNVSYNNFYYFTQPIIGLDNLVSLDLSGNDCRGMIENYFDPLSNLTSLRLRDVLLSSRYLAQFGKRLFSPLVRLENLDLSFNRLFYLPSDLFESLSTLKYIHLSDNYLSNIPNIIDLLALGHFDLSNNAFTRVDGKAIGMLEKRCSKNPNLKMYLKGNTFSCSCEADDFLLWLTETAIQMDGRDYACIDSYGNLTTTKSVLGDYQSYYRACVSSYWLLVSTAGMGGVLLMLLTTFILSHNKIQVKLFLLKLIGRSVFPKKRKQFKFDAYPIYTNSSRNLVCHQMIETLEGCYKLKLNIADRDHDVGVAKVNNIFEAIENSWKIILVFDEEFLRSELSYFTMCCCVSAISLTTPNRLIVLLDRCVRVTTDVSFLLENIPDRNVLHIDILNDEEIITDRWWGELYSIIVETN